MAEVAEILEQILSALSPKDLAGKHVLVTAGPTREYLDPIRFLSNRSSGKMGFALARAAARRGAQVTLVNGPTHLTYPAGISVVAAETAADMRDAVFEHLPGCDALVMAAAVADFVPETREKGKIGKTTLSSVRLKAAPDILAEVGALKERPLLVGFSAETGHDIDRAKGKMREKGADMMVFNDVLAQGSGFDSETNEITIIERERVTPLPLMTKDEAAEAVFDKICELLP
jgi:phosphopantothenoylcysteine decarboxylase/phosphopantothenate--cysteine ligase